ncbi:MAG: hypothetical protein QXR19_16030 [Candidatus Jordarchaeaceae archaeon]
MCIQVVKNVSDTLMSNLPQTIRGWRMGREKLAKILARAALLGAHPTRTAEILGAADEDTVSYQLRKVGMDCPQKLNLELSTTALELLEKNKEYILAVDTTEIEYWGKRDVWVHYSPGRGWVHRFVGLGRCGPQALVSPSPSNQFPQVFSQLTLSPGCLVRWKDLA